jgi:predicted TIM-barrel fold metal-dependent hydrolase
VRRVLHTPTSPSPGESRFVENVHRLAAVGLSFDICVAAPQLPDAIALARAVPEGQFILDHCGGPDVKARALDPGSGPSAWREHLREIASLPNVAGKVSGIVANADPNRWTTADLAPFVEHTIGCFGWDRVMFGSDWPVCTLSATLRQWVAALNEIVSGATEEERRKLFHDNAVRLYRL